MHHRRFSPILRSGVAFLVLALGLAATTFIIKQHNGTRHTSGPRQGQAVGGLPAASVPTLLLAISPSCHYCQMSMPFYRDLADKFQGRVKLLTTFPIPKEQAKQYLQENELSWEVSGIDSEALGVEGTPTLMLIDKEKRISKVWVGFLRRQQRQEVLQEIDRLCPNSRGVDQSAL